MRATLADLEPFHMLENNSILNKASGLSWKALHSHSLGRQNVKLALKIFSDTKIAASKSFGPENGDLNNWGGKFAFIFLVRKWCSILNVKYPFEERNTVNTCAIPIDCCQHENLQYLFKLADWLECWKDKNMLIYEGFLHILLFN